MVPLTGRDSLDAGAEIPQWGSYRSPIFNLLVEQGWDALEFQPRAVASLRADLRRRSKRHGTGEFVLPHAYLFAGPSGCGQEEAFVLLAASALCSDPCDVRRGEDPAETMTSSPEVLPEEDLPCGEDSTGPSPCWQCPDCKQVLAGVHPEVEIHEPEGNTYLVDFIRERAVAPSKYSAGGRRRYVLLREAERLSAPAANALLRTIEEPLGEVTFVLAASPDRDAVLPTLASRCVEVNFTPVSAKRLVDLLVRAGFQRDSVEAVAWGHDASLEAVAQAARWKSQAGFPREATLLLVQLLTDPAANPLEIAGLLHERIQEVVEEARKSIDAELEQATRSEKELGLDAASGRARVLRDSRHRRMRRLETTLCGQVVTSCESLALACGLIAAGLLSRARLSLGYLGDEAAQVVDSLAASSLSSLDSDSYLRRIGSLARRARSQLTLNPRVDLWLDGLATLLRESVSAG